MGKRTQKGGAFGRGARGVRDFSVETTPRGWRMATKLLYSRDNNRDNFIQELKL